MAPKPNLSFKLASESDIDRLILLYNDATKYKISKSDFSWGPRPDWDEADIQKYIDAKSTHLVLESGQLVGTVTLLEMDDSKWETQNSDALYLHRLAVSSKNRGRGLGEQIIAWCEGQVKASKKKYLRLDCDNNNHELGEYYQQQGFKKVRVLEPQGSLNYEAALYEKEVA